MKYDIQGEPLPVVICHLEEGESMITENGAMGWMSDNMELKTNTGGLGRMMSRAISGETMFQNVYTAKNGKGLVAFASCFPGQILPIELNEGTSIIAQKTAYLASTENVKYSVFFQKKIGVGLFGREGFIMQKFTGNGTVFLEIDGSLVQYILKPKQSMLVDSGYLAAMESTVSVDIEIVKGMSNVIFGSKGLLRTRVTGPGKIWLQTMPINRLTDAVTPYLYLSKDQVQK